MKTIVQDILKKFGFILNKYPSPDLARRIKLVHQYQIDTLFDVGANFGQYALEMRQLGYNKRIISFEPVLKTFEGLKKVAQTDPLWEVNHFALGDKNEKNSINISANTASSSILNATNELVASAPESSYVGKEEIEIKTLDTIFEDFIKQKSTIMLKVDTQGYEKNVLQGGQNSLAQIKLIQLELSLATLYQDEPLFKEMLLFLDSLGFDLVSLETGFTDSKTGKLLQTDGIFLNRTLSQ